MRIEINQLSLMGVKEAAEFLDISKPTLYRHIENHRIPHLELACGLIFLKHDLEVFKAERDTRIKHRRND